LIKPDIPLADVERFLWSHIRTDVGVIGHAVGKGKDDVLLLLHSILFHMVSVKIDRKFEPQIFWLSEFHFSYFLPHPSQLY